MPFLLGRCNTAGVGEQSRLAVGPSVSWVPAGSTQLYNLTHPAEQLTSTCCQFFLSASPPAAWLGIRIAWHTFKKYRLPGPNLGQF